MSEEIGFYIIAWGILIAFLVIRHFNKKKNYSDASDQQKVIDEIVRKRKTPAFNGPLFFKGPQEAFEYIQKFIDTLPLKKGAAYYGILGNGASMALREEKKINFHQLMEIILKKEKLKDSILKIFGRQKNINHIIL